MPAPCYRLFERYGVELEYMIVDAGTLQVKPLADRIVVPARRGNGRNEIRHGAARWSNELVMHVVELKTDGPSRTLAGLDGMFQGEVRHLGGLLRKHGARLLPTAMHPWMDPQQETRLWPHGNRTIYETFDRLFDCRGHGWSNLQSTHLNLPFRGDEEFRRLHTAIRLLLPLLPALAASSPFVEGRAAPVLDMRLEAYRHNCDRIPSIAGRIVPEWVPTPARYERQILDRIQRDLDPLDTEGVLYAEWVNARGAIARFYRQTIEIRVLDIQECPRADLAILQFIVEILKRLVDETLSPYLAQKNQRVGDLQAHFLSAVARAERSVIRDRRYLKALGMEAASAQSGEVLQSLLERVSPRGAPWRPTADFILRHGSLARRILRAAGKKPGSGSLHAVYARLADCLERGELFDP